jgi:NADPH-dependent 2,4-dienoyl-CoA reductase/sulfur reductase-like enzyme
MAGMAQRMLNLGGYDIGGRAVILGSGDVGMIVARELKKRGKDVVTVIEKQGVCGGLERNRATCLEAYNIPLSLHSTVTEIHGADRISGVTAQNLITGASEYIPCDTLIVSVGLIPERELLEGAVDEAGAIPDFLSVCGNACFVHDLADDVSEESERAGRLAADFARGRAPDAGAPGRKAKRELPPGTRICVACPKECAITEAPGGYAGMACGRHDPILAAI